MDINSLLLGVLGSGGIFGIIGFLLRKRLFNANVTKAEAEALSEQGKNKESLEQRVDRLVDEKLANKVQIQNLEQRLHLKDDQLKSANEDMQKILRMQGGNERELEIIRARNIEIERDFNNLRIQDNECQRALAELRGRLEVLEMRKD